MGWRTITETGRLTDPQPSDPGRRRLTCLRCRRLDRPAKGRNILSASTLPEFIATARRDAADAVAQQPDLAALYLCARESLAAAVLIVRLLRQDAIPASHFVAQQVRLNEYHERAERLLAKPGLAARWPTAAGTTFLWKVGGSALEATMRVAQAVYSATGIARMQAIGNVGHRAPPLVVSPEPDAKIVAWHVAAMVELQTTTMPTPAEWRIEPWEIIRDGQRVESLLDDEYRRAAAEQPAKLLAKAGRAKRGRMPKHDSDAKKAEMLATIHQHPTLANDIPALAKRNGVGEKTLRTWLKQEHHKFLNSAAAQ
jgi:hypothetical protein